MMLNCTGAGLEPWSKCNGHIILYVAIAVTPTLLLTIAALLLTICCLVRKYRRKKSFSLGGKAKNREELGRVDEEETEEYIDSEAEGTHVEGNKPKAFAEVMYASVECTPTTNDNNTKQPSAQGPHVNTAAGDGVLSQDVTTRKEQHRVKHPKGDAEVKVKKKKKQAKKKEGIVRKKTHEMTISGVRDEVQMQKEQSEPTFDGEVYNKLVHVTSQSQPQRHSSSTYSQIALENIEGRSGSVLDDGSKLNQRQRRGRTSSSPNEPPPLPPPFIDDEHAAVGRSAKSSLQTDTAAARRQKTFGIGDVGVTTQHANAEQWIYQNTQCDGGIQGLGTDLYNDPVGLPPRKDVYVNVVKR